VDENGVSEPPIWQVCQHRHLHDSHHFASGGANHLSTLGSSTVTMAGGIIYSGYTIANTLQIDSGVTVSGWGQITDSTGAAITNAGTIIGNTAGHTFTLNPGAGFTNAATGVIDVTNGTFNLSATNWSNAGNMSVTGGIMNLGGTFTTTGWNAMTHTAGAVNVTGTLNNGGILDIGSAGPFGANGLTQFSGTLVGGTLISGDGTAFNTNTGFLNGVTIGSNLTFTGNGTNQIQNNITIGNGFTVALGNNSWGFASAGNDFIHTLGASTITLAGSVIYSGYTVANTFTNSYKNVWPS